MGGGGKKVDPTFQARQAESARRSQEIYNANRGDVNWGRGELMNLYKGLGEGEGGGGGVGGGGGYTPAAFSDETTDFWRKLMSQGAYDELTRGAMESSATAPIRGMADMVRRGIQTAATGAGTGGGYASGLGQLFQDQAYAASEANKSAFANIQRMVAESKLQGAQGLEDIETKRRAFEAAERARRFAGAGRARSAAEADLATKRSLINQILGLDADNRDVTYQAQALGSAANQPADHSTRNAAIGAGGAIGAAAISALAI